MSTANPATKHLTELYEELKQILDPAKKAPPLGPYGELDAIITKGATLAARWRRMLQQHAGSVAAVVSREFGELAGAPKISSDKLAAALRAGGKVEPALLNRFAGYSYGRSRVLDGAGRDMPGPAAPKTWSFWSDVEDDGDRKRQRAATAPNPTTPGSANANTGVQLNVLGRDGLTTATRADEGGKTVTRLLIAFALPENMLLWFGQAIDANGEPVAKDRYIVGVNWIGFKESQDAYLLHIINITMDAKGLVEPDRFFSIRVEYIADSPEFERIRETVVQFKGLLEEWRQLFKGAPHALADNIAKAFDATRDTGAFTTAVLSPAELRRAFSEHHQIDDFQLSDLNQFASKWNSTFNLYQRDGSLFLSSPKFQTWLPVVPGPEGLYQRVVGSDRRHLNPVQVKGDEPDLLEYVLDAYLPDVGIGGWLSKKKPTVVECPLLAYKLAGDRFFWISQRYTEAELKKAKSKPEKPVSTVYDLALEWIVIRDGEKSCYLVNDTFDIDFKTGNINLTAQDFLIKSQSKL